MTKAPLLKLPMNPCPACGGITYYPSSGNCVACMQKRVRDDVMAKAEARRKEKEALKLVYDANNKPRPRHRPFLLEKIKTDEFRNFERIIMAGVKYENVEGRLM